MRRRLCPPAAAISSARRAAAWPRTSPRSSAERSARGSGDGSGRCACTADRVRAYRAKMSGPLLDRIDVHVVLPPVGVTALQGPSRGEASAVVRRRVEAARVVQRARATSHDVATCNGALLQRELDRVAPLCEDGTRLLAAAVERLALSARAYGKVLRVARTIADLDGSDRIRAPHVAEAIGLRVLDRGVLATAA